jgi:hypothetical protein
MMARYNGDALLEGIDNTCFFDEDTLSRRTHFVLGLLPFGGDPIRAMSA